ALSENHPSVSAPLLAISENGVIFDTIILHKILSPYFNANLSGKQGGSVSWLFILFNMVTATLRISIRPKD
ncbi:MAG: hypothetical protein V2I40_05445, partial [Desulfobacteraceae bacterium]|nr:hypothetical protein [Desulfobacteraceae bacterium]